MVSNAIDLAAQRCNAIILLPCLLTGGTEVATLETALALKSLGYQVDVLVYFNEVDLTMLNTFKQAGFKVRLLGVQRAGGLLSQAQLAIRLLKALVGQKYQVIWLQ